jgi:hypothetical protein
VLNSRLSRLAGWAALLSGIFMLLAVVSFPLGAGMLGGALEVIFLLLTILVFYALYLAYRPESAGLSLAGFVLLVLAIVADLISMVNYGNALLSNVWYSLFCLPFLIFGVLAYRDSRMPRGLAVVSVLTGAAYLIVAVAGWLGQQPVIDTVELLAILLVLAWLFWIWRVFWSGRMVAPSGHAATA